MNRLEQLTRNLPYYYSPLKKFNNIVPQNATVSTYLTSNAFEYILFGEKLTRTIIPIISFENEIQQIPQDAEYLLYTNDFPCRINSDIELGENLFLRKLTENNRECNQ